MWDLPQKKGVFYNPPELDTFEKYLSDRDPVLGWPSKSQLAERYDAEGSRPIPAFPDPQTPSCVSIYGDSFVWSDHVEADESVPNALAVLMNCRVSNFGVSGYGTDQMVLRFKSMADEAPIVVLNHFSGDIRRNVTRMRNLMAESNSQYILLKPRYILKDGKLELLALPTPTKEEASCYANSPEKCLTNEYFLPGGESGINYLRFPFILSLVKSLKNEHIQSKFQGIPVWSRFYKSDHPSNALALTREIILEFVRSAKEKNKTPVVAVTANVHDIEFFRKTNSWSYQPLIDELGKFDVVVLNLGVGIDQQIGANDPCDYGNESCYGHYKAEGNKHIAEIFYNHIKGIARN